MVGEAQTATLNSVLSNFTLQFLPKMKKSLFLLSLICLSFNSFANGEDGSNLDQTLLTAGDSNNILSFDEVFIPSFVPVRYCYWSTGTVYCRDGSSDNVWTSFYDDPNDAVTALMNNANNFCNGGDYFIDNGSLNSTYCP